jgi:tRNA-dependent cyclodipeptide synthase
VPALQSLVSCIEGDVKFAGISLYPARHNIVALFSPDEKRVVKAKHQLQSQGRTLAQRLDQVGLAQLDWSTSNPGNDMHLPRMQARYQQDQRFQTLVYEQTELVIRRKLKALRLNDQGLEQRLANGVAYQLEELATLLALPMIFQVDSIALPLLHPWPALEYLASIEPALMPIIL